jgi:hypothetical protein
MDRNDSNPGMVEREMDETPMEGRSTEREGMGGGSVEREGMQGQGSERDGMQGNELERDGMGGMERESLDRGGSVEREGMQGGGMERDGGAMEGMSQSDREIMQGTGSGQGDMGTPSDRLHESNSNVNDTEMRSSGRDGGYGYDRPADVEVSREDMQGSSRDTDQGTDRERGISGDQPGGTTTARDW